MEPNYSVQYADITERTVGSQNQNGSSRLRQTIWLGHIFVLEKLMTAGGLIMGLLVTAS